MAEDSGPRDLLGDPWTPPRDPRGRKSHRPSPQGREKVAVLRGGGATEEEIALQLGLDPKTLRKYYSRELDHGLELARNAALAKLYEKGMQGDGNTAALRAFLAETEKGKAAKIMREQRAHRTPVEPVAPAPKPVGKKEARQAEAAEAAEAGSMYAPGPPPRLHS